MSVQWYCSSEGRSFGPYDASQINQMIALREPWPADMLWRDGMAEWLYPRSPNSAPPQPAPPPPNPGTRKLNPRPTPTSASSQPPTTKTTKPGTTASPARTSCAGEEMPLDNFSSSMSV